MFSDTLTDGVKQPDVSVHVVLTRPLAHDVLADPVELLADTDEVNPDRTHFGVLVDDTCQLLRRVPLPVAQLVEDPALGRGELRQGGVIREKGNPSFVSLYSQTCF